MKIPFLTGLLILGASLPPSFAAEKSASPAGSSPTGPAAEAPEWDKQFRGVTLPAVWQRAQAALAKIEAGLATKAYADVAVQAETIHLAAHALDDQVKLEDRERQKRLRGALSQAAKIADDVIEAAERKAPDELAEAFRRLSAAMRLAGMRLPKEITAAPK